MKNHNNNPDPKEKGNNDPLKKDGGLEKFPDKDPDATPEKEIQDPPVANPDKDKGQIDHDKKEIGFNK